MSANLKMAKAILKLAGITVLPITLIVVGTAFSIPTVKNLFEKQWEANAIIEEKTEIVTQMQEDEVARIEQDYLDGKFSSFEEADKEYQYIKSNRYFEEKKAELLKNDAYYQEVDKEVEKRVLVALPCVFATILGLSMCLTYHGICRKSIYDDIKKSFKEAKKAKVMENSFRNNEDLNEEKVDL